MTTKQTDAYWGGQNFLLEEFCNWLNIDFTYADQKFEEFRDDPNVNDLTYEKMDAAREAHLQRKTEDDNEEMLNRQTMHL